ncbi:MAG: TonB-dependent receptor [Nitrosomonadales bacterium]|nr:TonB-dependent receptor [Nitrosomonadales bacterium]
MKHSKWKLKPGVMLLATLFAGGAYAQDDGAVKTEDISVFGKGQSRQVQTITSEDMKKAVAGTSPLKVLEKLPGVNFQSADPFGAYEWSTRLVVRGFGQSYMGFTLDGVPLGDMSYGNNNGLHISRAISSENVGRATLSQGAGAMGTASTSNLGGTVAFVSADPDNKSGVRLDQTMGSANMSRTFARFDTGTLESGTKAFVSVTSQRAEKWKGEGRQNQDQFNSKLVHIFGESRVSAFLNTSDRTEIDYQDMSLDMQQKLGWGWDNYAPNWTSAINAANGVFSPAVASINANTGPLDAAYYQGSGLRKDKLMGFAADIALNDATRLKATYYSHNDIGQGHWYTPYTASPGTAAGAGVYTGPGLPISIRTTEYGIDRKGIVSSLTWNLDKHTVEAGIWYEKSLSTLTRNFYAATGPADTNYFLTNPFQTGFMQEFTATTTQFHVQDSVALLDGKMKANFGFKSPSVKIDAVSLVGSRAAGTLTASKTLLPQAGFNYNLSEKDEVFASVAQNMRAFQPGVSGPFSQTQAVFDANTANLNPETSTSYEAGYRFRNDALQGSVAAYLTDFKDRLLSVATCQGIVGCPSTFVNVGQVRSQGVEAALAWNMVQNWNWFNSLTLNDSKYKTDYMNGNTLVNVTGMQVVDAPRLMFNTDIAYDDGHWFGSLGGKYTDKRYYTYLNDGVVPAFWVMNAAAGYKQKNLAGMKDFSVQLSMTNVLDKKYFGTIGSNGFVQSDAQGAFATMLEGAPRQMFLTASTKF